jgi:superfamily I DNA/RNA helicase
LRAKFSNYGKLDAIEYIEKLFEDDEWIEESEVENSPVRLGMSSLRYAARSIAEAELADGEVHARDKVLKKVAQRLRYQIATREQLVVVEGLAQVQVTTLWGAKGVTADHVYILGLCEEALPGSKRPEYPGTDLEFRDEQQRLLYVSITRPKQTLIMSRPKRIRFGEASQLGISVTGSDGGMVQLKVCPFLRSIAQYLPEAKSGHSWTWD